MEQEGGGSDMMNKNQLKHQKQQKQEVAVQVKCPRCDSMNTKFCYYNNYSLSQPRYFCRACRRYWTHGGALRNVPVGGRSRKPKRPKFTNDNNNHSSDENNCSHSSLTEAMVVGVPSSFLQGGVGGIGIHHFGGSNNNNLGVVSGFNNVVGSHSHHQFYHQMMMGNANQQQGLMMMNHNNNRATTLNPEADGSLWSNTAMVTTTTTHRNNNDSIAASSSAAAAFMANQWPNTVTGFGPPPSSF
ncbi:hypothetical protein PIB30_002752 [Stylosanthes scabra]|uniref:Dof zinc finger protein n=1 Tax=Stylosanthes scabra TaxID=79078 RepID=A0ABU6S3F8_9FABA|nr:hypothetical protein [Stylosanthes scabra]